MGDTSNQGLNPKFCGHSKDGLFINVCIYVLVLASELWRAKGRWNFGEKGRMGNVECEFEAFPGADVGLRTARMWRVRERERLRWVSIK